MMFVVDAEILKAAAMDHPKDIDQAVESIINGVLPCIAKQSDASSSYSWKLDTSRGTLNCQLPSEAAKSNGKSVGQMAGSTCESSSKQGLIAGEDNNGSQEMTGSYYVERAWLDDILDDYLCCISYDPNYNEDQLNLTMRSREFMSSKYEKAGMSLNTHGDTYLHCDRVLGDTEGEECNASHKDQVLGGDLDVNMIPFSSLTSAAVTDNDADSCLRHSQSICMGYFSSIRSCDLFESFNIYMTKSLDHGKSVDLALLHMKDQTSDAFNCKLQSAVETGGNPASNGCDDTGLNQGISVHDMVDDEGSFGRDMISTQAGQNCTTVLLEDTIEQAKSRKKTLFAAMESVTGLMREVELLEKAAGEAEETAAKLCVQILARVEEFKKKLVHAKEANGMRAEEVYGEKAILATKVMELQSRLLALADDMEKSLSMLDEMHHALEGQVDAAEGKMRAAERERLENEEYARTTLADLELNMEKVVQESKILQKEAEENAKLRVFLMDKGHVVDVLQGEISVICQDVETLKENFDKRIPFSRSFSSKETSCLLAFSSSSQKSKASHQAPKPAESSESSESMSQMPLTDPTTPQSSSTEVGIAKDLSDEDWEFFEDDGE
ncbi:hypothetical protein Ancab_021913 [Ancistrocladus abbreviatus]